MEFDKFLGFVVCLILLTSGTWAADTTPPTTTFTSNTITGTIDENITLTCTDAESGCKEVNYNIDSLGWQKKGFSEGIDRIVASFNFNSDLNGWVQKVGTVTTSGGYMRFNLDSWAYTQAKFDNNNVANKSIYWKGTLKLNGANGILIGFTSGNNNYGSAVASPGYFIQLTTTTGSYLLRHNGDDNYTQLDSSAAISTDTDYNVLVIRNNDGNFNVYINDVLVMDAVSTTYTDFNYMIVNSINGNYGYAKNIEYGYYNFGVDNISYSFLYNGAGFHEIQYYSVDNVDNNETTKDGNWFVYGLGKFTFRDEVGGALFNGVTVTSTLGDNETLDGNVFDTNFSTLGVDNVQVTYTFTKSGYATRYYSVDLNGGSFFNKTFVMLSDVLDRDISFKVYQPDQTTLYNNTYVEVLDKDTNYTVGRLKTNDSAEATFNLKNSDMNYWTVVDNGAFTYTPVTLTILYPIDEQSYIQIGNKWRVDISQNFYAQYLNLDANLVVFLLPNTLLPFNVRVGDMNGDYFYRSYTKQYLGNPLTDTLQPYLVPYEEGLGTVLHTIFAYTNQPYPNIIIKVYKLSSVTGRTFVESITTDSKGEGFVLMTVGEDYEFELYYGETNEYIRTDTINTVSSAIYLKIPSPNQDVDVKPTTNYYTINTKFLPNIGKLLFTTTSLTQTITLTNTGSNTDTLSSIKIWITNNDTNIYSETFATTAKTYTNTLDINTISQVLDGNAYDGNYTLVIYVQVTTSTGAITLYKWTYSPPKDHDLVKGFGSDLKGFVGCANTSDPLIPCPTLLIAALFLSLILTIGFASETGFSSMEGMGVVFLVIMAIFTYLSWVPYLLYGLMVLATIVIASALGGNKL